jgi:hypothetical protein
VAIPLVWPAVQAAAIAGRQRSRLGELEQARARWETRPFSSYHLTIQFYPRDGSVCEQAFEVNEPAQAKILGNTCASSLTVDNIMNFLGSRISIPGLFDYIEAEIGRVRECGPNGCACDGARTIDAVYDSELGYPKRIEIRFQRDWTTQRLQLGCSTIGWFTPGPATVTVKPLGMPR